MRMKNLIFVIIFLLSLHAAAKDLRVTIEEKEVAKKCYACAGKGKVKNHNFDKRKLGSQRMIRCPKCAGKKVQKIARKAYTFHAGEKKMTAAAILEIDADEIENVYYIKIPTYGGRFRRVMPRIVYSPEKKKVQLFLSVSARMKDNLHGGIRVACLFDDGGRGVYSVDSRHVKVIYAQNGGTIYEAMVPADGCRRLKSCRIHMDDFSLPVREIDTLEEQKDLFLLYEFLQKGCSNE